MQAIAAELIRLEVVDYIPEADAEFVAKMEDVLDVYQRPYDSLRPVVCLDETNKQLIKENCIPYETGQPEKVDSVYVRNGAADIFMISPPWQAGGKRLWRRPAQHWIS